MTSICHIKLACDVYHNILAAYGAAKAGFVLKIAIILEN
jgi:hypothetical protein